MRPNLATVLSARDWESELVQASRRTGRLRVVGRAYNPEDLDHFGPVDSIAIGSETAWLDSGLIHQWKRRGSRVIGVHPAGDNPGKNLFNAAHADLVMPDTADPIELVHRICLLALDPQVVSVQSRVLAVTGLQGAPGRTSVAVGLGLVLEDSFLIDAELLPGIGPRFSLGPNSNRLTVGSRPLGFTHPRSSRQPFDAPLIRPAVASARSIHANVVVDCGVFDPGDPQLRSSDAVVLVVDASTTGLIRAGRALEHWTMQEPIIVLNKVDDPSNVQSCRYATGIEPSAIIPRLDTSDPILIAQAMTSHLAGLAQGLTASG